jgi:hypothetical protein
MLRYRKNPLLRLIVYFLKGVTSPEKGYKWGILNKSFLHLLLARVAIAGAPNTHGGHFDFSF